MHIAQSNSGNKAPTRAANSICPYRNVDSVYCPAAVMKMPISRQRNTNYCLTEDFDCCPAFLAKVLRGNRIRSKSLSHK